MMDFSFLDNDEDETTNKPELNAPAQLQSEYDMLKELADKVGLYQYEYNQEAQDNYGYTDEEHNGIVAQELQTVPGLASAIEPNEDGVLTVDTKKVALAALGYVAALTRIVMEMRGDFDGTANNSTTVSEQPVLNTDTAESDTNTTEASGTESEPESEETSVEDGNSEVQSNQTVNN